MEPLWRGAGKWVFEDPRAQWHVCKTEVIIKKPRSGTVTIISLDGRGRGFKGILRFVSRQSWQLLPLLFIPHNRQTDRQTDGHPWVSSQQWDAGWKPTEKRARAVRPGTFRHRLL